jgi:L-seryl-tRNA(Ser) seleniumtransferase
MELVFQPVFKTGKGRIIPALAGSIPALSVLVTGCVMADYKDIPSVTAVLKNAVVLGLIKEFGEMPVKEAIRCAIAQMRDCVKNKQDLPTENHYIQQIRTLTGELNGRSFSKVVNATGIILHTNLGRAPLGQQLLEEITPLLSGYSNLEFDLAKGKRGSRYVHIRECLKLITGAEDVLVVNNNASSVILALNALCKGGEVIISRSELIEIGGSFRLPEIFEAAGCKLVEVGATNKCRISDYENAITENTKAILKVHQSNFAIIGFTLECGLPELKELAVKHNLPLLYDLGSGLLRKPANLPLESEPDVKTSIEQGADLVMFSGDKLLGGPQGGILVGSKDIIKILSKTPLLRALRISKLDLAALTWVCRQYLDDSTLKANVPIFSMLEKSLEVLKADAEKLAKLLTKGKISCEVLESQGQVGGGTLPHLKLPSFAVALKAQGSAKEKKHFAEKLHRKLMTAPSPVIGILREGELLFDVLTLFEGQNKQITESIISLLAE